MDMSFENQGLFAPVETGPGLRRMTWHELCARISAVQDFRRIMAADRSGGDVASTGSFSADTARIVASAISGITAQRADYEGLVNPNSSVNGKADPADPEGQLTGVRPSRAEARD